jgi:hypothetical protein
MIHEMMAGQELLDFFEFQTADFSQPITQLAVESFFDHGQIYFFT